MRRYRDRGYRNVRGIPPIFSPHMAALRAFYAVSLRMYA
jgi:hypothetical protein